jgi:hypothetical protein
MALHTRATRADRPWLLRGDTHLEVCLPFVHQPTRDVCEIHGRSTNAGASVTCARCVRPGRHRARLNAEPQVAIRRAPFPRSTRAAPRVRAKESPAVTVHAAVWSARAGAMVPGQEPIGSYNYWSVIWKCTCRSNTWRPGIRCRTRPGRVRRCSLIVYSMVQDASLC